MKVFTPTQDYQVQCNACTKTVPIAVRVVDYEQDVQLPPDADGNIPTIGVPIQVDLCHHCVTQAASLIKPHFLASLWVFLGLK